MMHPAPSSLVHVVLDANMIQNVLPYWLQDNTYAQRVRMVYFSVLGSVPEAPATLGGR